MNGTINNYLLDTNIFIYYFNGESLVQPIFNEIITGNAIGFYCPITWSELLCYPNLSAEEANQIRAFLRSMNVVQLTETVLNCTAEIRRDYRLKIPDALIAACALKSSSILVTRNIQDFQRVVGLSLLNPFNP
ncbi:type II toxin-antitoxin system VapC family toxin [Aerosakkonemataceae cyanobacterium BLCC-F154]|uniref:Type II toxin-antitoxin system VapC family toxin n=1 Tax=Floridaenema fluviatile BLCC-F154 TaxID=3153640 RepID=A0ABV4Y512_9CYAN